MFSIPYAVTLVLPGFSGLFYFACGYGFLFLAYFGFVCYSLDLMYWFGLGIVVCVITPSVFSSLKIVLQK